MSIISRGKAGGRYSTKFGVNYTFSRVYSFDFTSSFTFTVVYSHSARIFIRVSRTTIIEKVVYQHIYSFFNRMNFSTAVNMVSDPIIPLNTRHWN